MAQFKGLERIYIYYLAYIYMVYMIRHYIIETIHFL